MFFFHLWTFGSRPAIFAYFGAFSITQLAWFIWIFCFSGSNYFC